MLCIEWSPALDAGRAVAAWVASALAEFLRQAARTLAAHGEGSAPEPARCLVGCSLVDACGVDIVAGASRASRHPPSHRLVLGARNSGSSHASLIRPRGSTTAAASESGLALGRPCAARSRRGARGRGGEDADAGHSWTSDQAAEPACIGAVRTVPQIATVAPRGKPGEEIQTGEWIR